MIQFILFVSAVVSGLWVPLCLCAAICPSRYCTLVEPNHVWPLSATPAMLWPLMCVQIQCGTPCVGLNIDLTTTHWECIDNQLLWYQSWV